ncbi:hypothetical protein, partial [Buchananella hordeovulneris]|uniref:hypothetical protein n=1 Tax=Buchananella hordeovulneris TaxID=52770 RepID=UPI001C9E36B7
MRLLAIALFVAAVLAPSQKNDDGDFGFEGAGSQNTVDISGHLTYRTEVVVVGGGEVGPGVVGE